MLKGQQLCWKAALSSLRKYSAHIYHVTFFRRSTAMWPLGMPSLKRFPMHHQSGLSMDPLSGRYTALLCPVILCRPAFLTILSEVYMFSLHSFTCLLQSVDLWADYLHLLCLIQEYCDNPDWSEFAYEKLLLGLAEEVVAFVLCSTVMFNKYSR